MLASPQIKTVKPPYKKPSISERSSFLHWCSVKIQFVWQKLSYHILLVRLLQRHVGLVIHPKNTKNPLCVCTRCSLWYYYESVCFIETMTCQRLVSVGNLN